MQGPGYEKWGIGERKIYKVELEVVYWSDPRDLKASDAFDDLFFQLGS